MTNWHPNTCDCTFTFNPDGTLYGASKGSQFGHDLLSDAAALQAVKDQQAAIPAPIPESVKPYAIRRALLDLGHYANVIAAVNAAGDIYQIAWEYALEYKRTDPMINGMATALGLTEAQVDEIYILAKEYE